MQMALIILMSWLLLASFAFIASWYVAVSYIQKNILKSYQKEELLTELKKWENGVQLIECGHIERAQKKLYNEDKALRTAKDT